jgi:hypothetical protein
MLSRRRFIRIAGATGAAGVLIAGGGYWAATRGGMPDSAVAPWQAPGQDLDDPRLKAAAFAMLAPNPHNIQPWRLKLVGNDAVDLHVDLARLLPETDPPGRQILIGHGTFLELYRMAAAEMGYRADIALLPDGPFEPERLDARRVASVRLVRDTKAPRDPLFAHVGQRRSNKEPYDTSREVPGGAVGRLAEVVGRGFTVTGTADPAARQTFRDLAEAALKLEIETPHTLKESIDLMRIGPSEVAANPDGIDLLGPMIWWGERMGIFSRDDLSRPGTETFEVGLQMARDQAQTAMAFAWLTSPDNSRMSQLQAGMSYLRMNLAAARDGLAMHPMSQLLQEYPEMSDLQDRFLKQDGVRGGGHVQMLVRLGYGEAPGPSPRRRVADIMAA